MEATGYSRWFERLLAELGIEVWIGDAAEISRELVTSTHPLILPSTTTPLTCVYFRKLHR
jgi:hypothetical protein